MQPEGHGGLCAMGKQGFAPSGVYDYGTLEEDGPETWEALISPCEAADPAESRKTVSDAQCACGMRMLPAAEGSTE